VKTSAKYFGLVQWFSTWGMDDEDIMKQFWECKMERFFHNQN